MSSSLSNDGATPKKGGSEMHISMWLDLCSKHLLEEHMCCDKSCGKREE